MLVFLDHNYIYDGRLGRLEKYDPDDYNFYKQIVNEYKDSVDEIRFREEIVFSRTRDENEGAPSGQIQRILKNVIITLTEKCNLRCTYCPYPGDPNRSHHISGKYFSDVDLDYILSFLIKNASPETAVSFYGGEPILRFKDMMYIIKHLRDSRPDWEGRYSFTTNLTLYSHNIFKVVAESGGVILVSLDGPEHLHDRNRNFANKLGSFNVVFDNLRKLKKDFSDFCRSRVGINCVIAHKSFDDLNNFFGLHFDDISLIRFTIVDPTNSNNIDKQYVMGIKEEYSRWGFSRISTVSDIDSLRKNPLLIDFLRKKLLPILSMDGVKFERRRYSSCALGEKAIIKSDLSIGVCEKLESYNIGDVKNGIGSDNSLHNQFADLLKNRCRKCAAAPICKACKAFFWDGEKFSREKLDSHCTELNKDLERRLSAFVNLRERIGNFDTVLKRLTTGGSDVFS